MIKLLLLIYFIIGISGLNQLSFSGGGAFGAIEIGIIKKLNEIDNKHYDIYTGISAGGLNVGILSYFHDLTLGIKEAETIYSEMRTHHVYEVLPQTGVSLLNTHPLFKTLTEIVDKMPNPPCINTMIGATNLYTGNLDVYNFNEIDNKNKVLLLMSTSAIPVVFPPITFQKNMYADGGTLSNELLDIIHTDRYLNITYITPYNGLIPDTNPITDLKEMIVRTIQVVKKNYNNPISKLNQNCNNNSPIGEINMYYVNSDRLAGYSMLSFNHGQELIDIGYNNMEHKKYTLC